MNKYKSISDFFDELDLTDSIIENISFDKNLTDLKIEVTHFFDEDKLISIKFNNCYKFDYELSKDIYILNDNQLNFSHFTITKILIDEGINIFTINDDEPLIKIMCQTVELE
ncbi:hypothetical protein [Enterococcus sp. AZ192]|uniref:hypothetical protein n=1 Tax=unclassified Enterococcus TaxID=2608891 RepID=UPI003D2842A6